MTGAEAPMRSPSPTAGVPAPRPDRNRAHPWRYRAAVLVVFAAFNLVTFNRFFPLSEGWWETYGYLWNTGLRPYRDFDLAFTPLFTIVNAGLLRVFGDSFFALRLFGVAVFLVAVLVLELLLERFFSPRNAAVAVTVSTFLAISGPQFIAKDYHTYQLGLVACVLALQARLAEDGLSRRRRLAGTVALGAAITLVFFLKQNVGALLLVAVAVSIVAVERRGSMARLAALAAGVAIPLLVMSPVVSAGDWRRLLLANDAKGSLDTVLLRFWRLVENREAILAALALCAAAAAGRWVFAPPESWRGIFSARFEATLRSSTARRVAFLALVAAVAASGHRMRAWVFAWGIPVTLAFLVLTLGRAARAVARPSPDVAPRWVAIALPLAALAYANTTTAAFDFIAMNVPVAFAIAWLLAAIERRVPPRYAWVAALALLVVVPEVVAAKLRVPYAWWANWQGSVAAATAEASYPQLRGIRMTPEQRDVVNAIHDAVATYSRSRSDVLFFGLPMFYWLDGKLPPDRTVVQWFDVVSSAQMQEELRAIRERPPRLIVALEPPEAAYVVHRRLKNSPHLPQEDFRALLDEWVATRKYVLVRSMAPPSGDKGGWQLEQDVVVQSARADGAELGALLSDTGVQAIAAPAPGTTARSGASSGGSPTAGRLARGQVVRLRGEYTRVRAASELFGIARGGARDWNAVGVYVRADAEAPRPEPDRR